ncbi:MAG: HEPN domain-containing protein [Polyangiales bacterium]
MSPDPVVMAYLEGVREEIDAVARLAAPPTNRLAAYHLQRVSEKLVKAVRLHRGHPATQEHRISLLLGALTATAPWRERLEPLDRFSQFATTYRYPSPTGRLRSGPDAAMQEAGRFEVDTLLSLARSEFGGA